MKAVKTGAQQVEISCPIFFLVVMDYNGETINQPHLGIACNRKMPIDQDSVDALA